MALNKSYVLFHLEEAREELIRTIHELHSGQDFDCAEYRVAMRHLFHHINTAWNARSAPEERVAECSEEDFQSWRQFPVDLEI